MTDAPKGQQWKTLDTDLHRISRVEQAATYAARPMVGFGIALAFIVFAALSAGIFLGYSSSNYVVIAAAAFGADICL